MPIVAPSILAADFLHLARDVEMINNSEAEWIHIDVMDGHFVPNISFGFPVLKAIRSATDRFLDVHLMISNPDDYIAEFADAGADCVSIHFEGNHHLHRSLNQIRSKNIKAGLVLNPQTNIDVCEDLISELDLILLMSVNPGFGGQSFIENTINKAASLRALLAQKGAQTIVEVDGGVNTENAPALVAAGVDVLVAGSSVFKSADPIATIAQLNASSQ